MAIRQGTPETYTAAVVWCLLALVVILSLPWRIQHDSPLMLYIGFMIDRFDAVPYRDLYDVNLGGTYFLNFLISRLIGCSDLALRLVDLFFLGAMILAARWGLKDFGPAVAWGGPGLFGLFYLVQGPEMSLQREFVFLLPVALAVLVARRARKWPWSVKAGVIGCLFGVAFLIKPGSLVGLPIVLWFLTAEICSERGASVWSGLAAIFLPTVAGLIVFPAVWLFYLWQSGGLPEFVEIATEYWPLYAGLNQWHETISGSARWKYLIEGFLEFGHQTLLFVPATLGAYMMLFQSQITRRQKRCVYLLIGLALAYSVYPAANGKFWTYHWLPFTFCVVLLGATCLSAKPEGFSRWQRRVPVMVLLAAFVLSVRPPEQFLTQVRSGEMEPPKEGRVDAIATYLQSNLVEGDLVQPLDWTGGAIHAMLIAEARLATPFMYDFHFYHHLSFPYIQNLRRRFIARFNEAEPRFVVEITRDKPWVCGKDTSRDFPELRQVLAARYAPVQSGEGYVIYERSNGP